MKPCYSAARVVGTKVGIVVQSEQVSFLLVSFFLSTPLVPWCLVSAMAAHFVEVPKAGKRQ
jgi:hypothetical protein